MCLMLAALIIVFREVFEAGLIVGIVLAVTSSVPPRNRWIGGGVLAGVAAACLVAAFAGVLSQLFEGMGQELFEIFVYLRCRPRDRHWSGIGNWASASGHRGGDPRAPDAVRGLSRGCPAYTRAR